MSLELTIEAKKSSVTRELATRLGGRCRGLLPVSQLLTLHRVAISGGNGSSWCGQQHVEIDVASSDVDPRELLQRLPELQPQKWGRLSDQAPADQPQR